MNVFCKDCRHLSRYLASPRTGLVLDGDTCSIYPTRSFDPIRGEVIRLVAARERNANLNCKFFEANPPPEPSFWARLFARKART